MKRLTAVLLLSAMGSAACAQMVYRCGPDGREYSQSPCPGASAIQLRDTRDDGQRREAIEIAKRDAALADQLARERHAREAMASRQVAAGFKSSAVTQDAAKQAAKSSRKKNWKSRSARL